MRHLLPAAVVTLLLAGCAAQLPEQAAEPPAASPVSRVTLGMSSSDVQAVMGAPRTIEGPPGQDGDAVWYYDSGVVVLTNGKVAFTYPTPASGL
jgi:hypothetical protein